MLTFKLLNTIPEWEVSTHELFCSWVRCRTDLGLFQIFVVAVFQPEITKQKHTITNNEITGASGLRGWIRLVEALSISTIGASSSFLGDQHIQKQLKKVKHRPTSGFGDIFLYGFPIYSCLGSFCQGVIYRQEGTLQGNHQHKNQKSQKMTSPEHPGCADGSVSSRRYL